jgi:Na+/H+ antiporter NhaA
MPLFAFANAGVVFDLSNMVIFSGISLSIIVGLFFGKTIRYIPVYVVLLLKSGISRLPHGMTMENLAELV